MSLWLWSVAFLWKSLQTWSLCCLYESLQTLLCLQTLSLYCSYRSLRGHYCLTITVTFPTRFHRTCGLWDFLFVFPLKYFGAGIHGKKVKLVLIPSWETILSLTVYPRLYVWLVIRDVRTKETEKKRVKKRERRGTHEAGKREKGKEIERGGRVRGPWYENNNCVSSFPPFLINYTSAPPSLGLWCMSSTQDRYVVFCLTRWGEHRGWKL